jgi:hypothetical protein
MFERKVHPDWDEVELLSQAAERLQRDRRSWR